MFYNINIKIFNEVKLMHEEEIMCLFVTKPWPLFYEKAMKEWDVRAYSTDYRGPILIVESKTNKVVCLMDLVDCIPLTKELWENNYDKHRVQSSFENLPYNKGTDKPAVAWVLKNPRSFKNEITIPRKGRSPYIYIDKSIISENETSTIKGYRHEHILCRFDNNEMVLYWCGFKKVKDFIIEHFNEYAIDLYKGIDKIEEIKSNCNDNLIVEPFFSMDIRNGGMYSNNGLDSKFNYFLLFNIMPNMEFPS